MVEQKLQATQEAYAYGDLIDFLEKQVAAAKAKTSIHIHDTFERRGGLLCSSLIRRSINNEWLYGRLYG